MDKIIHDANAEISNLQNKLSTVHLEHENLARKNYDLVEAYREKSRKHLQTQELYDRLKRKALMSDVQTAASESVDQVLQSASGHRFTERAENAGLNLQYQGSAAAQRQRQYPHFLADHTGIEQLHHHQRDGSGGSGGSGNMGPPPGRPAANYGDPGFGIRKSIAVNQEAGFDGQLEKGTTATPSQHRTRLPTPARPGRQSGQLQTHNHQSGLTGKPQDNLTSMPRQPLSGINPNSLNSNGMSGYGMSAGMKVGRQQPTGSGSFDPRMGKLRVAQRPGGTNLYNHNYRDVRALNPEAASASDGYFL
ncbi:MAG: hypothetical protein M1830_001791 [Pleopsidium flavum]|nr:MAG: hypothetical protein M1830_001791 [Pleopsidium flavum]